MVNQILFSFKFYPNFNKKKSASTFPYKKMFHMQVAKKARLVYKKSKFFYFIKIISL